MRREGRPILKKLVIDTMRAKGVKRIKIWFKDADGKIDDGMFEEDDIELVDSLGFEWGCLQIEDEMNDFGLFDPTNICYTPRSHDFEKKVMFNLFYHKCKNCGYSPEYDGNKEEYKEVHRQWLNWNRSIE